MNSTFRRFEILLPLRFNDGTPVPDAAVADTLFELEMHFGAVSAETQHIEGRWRHLNQSYRDELVRIFVDVSDAPENIQHFRDLKQRLKDRFQQIDIWVTSYPIDVI